MTRAVNVDADVSGVHRHGERFRGRKPRGEPPVDEQTPHVAVRDPSDEVLDVDAAVAQRGAFLVRLGDLGLEGDDTLEPGLEHGLVGHRGS
jgi:hypothetical protein